MPEGYRITNDTIDVSIPMKYSTYYKIFDLYYTKVTEFFPNLAAYDPLLLYCNKKFGAEKQPLGINPIFNIPKIIAQDLGLDNPHLYTAKKCFSKVGLSLIFTIFKSGQWTSLLMLISLTGDTHFDQV